VAKRLGSLSRSKLLAVLAVGTVLVLVAWLLAFRDTEVEPHLTSSEPTATIGSGADAVAVAADGTTLPWLPAPEDGSLPELPLDAPPGSGRLEGPVLEQAIVLGAAPRALRPYLARSYYGESGVDVELDSGIELRFGDVTQVSRKWRAAAAVLADPSITALDYVNLHAPSHPAIGGSGHALPPIS
jgi:hypothetical protein